MNNRWRSFLWWLITAVGVCVTLVSLVAFRREDWPIYVTFILVYLLVYFPSVEVLPGLVLHVPNLAVVLGFLYIGGLPILFLRGITPFFAQPLSRALANFPATRRPDLATRIAEPVLSGIPKVGISADLDFTAEWATFAIGLATRWWIVRALIPDGPTTANLWAIGVAELGGHAVWAVLSILPIFSDHTDRTLFPLALEPNGLRAALTDLGLLIWVALTPFVFFIVHGYRSGGLLGATAWSLSTLGLHLMLKRLNDRRLGLEEQNRRLEQLNRELEHRERLSAIGKMSSVVSHQVLHQLGVIGLHADLLRGAGDRSDGKEIPTEVRESAQAIDEALEEVNRTLTDLLVFSRDLRLNLYSHNLKDILDDCISSCRPDADRKDVTLQLTCPAELDVTVDMLKVKQAVANVLRNAVEVSPPGSRVEVSGRVVNGQAEIRISDQGPGVREDQREVIFTPFFTTKENGTGLGLAIAREFVNAHGGRLWVEASKGAHGATFVFIFPEKTAQESSL